MFFNVMKCDMKCNYNFERKESNQNKMIPSKLKSNTLKRRNESEQKEISQKLRLNSLLPINKDQTSSLLFTRSKKLDSKQIRFHFYSLDETTFYLVASLINDSLYFISTNSNEVLSKLWEIGTLKDTKNGTFTGITFNPSQPVEITFFNSIRIHCIEESSSIHVRVAPLNCDRFIFLEKNAEAENSLKFDQISTKPMNSPNGEIINLFHFGLEFQGNLCFTFNQRYEDEFLVQFSHPFSLFQAFCIAIAAASSFCA